MTHRAPGPIGTAPLESTSLDDGTLIRSSSTRPGPVGTDVLSARPALNDIKGNLSQIVRKSRPLAHSQLVDAYRKKWLDYVDEIAFKAPAKDKGALWSKLDPKSGLNPRTGKPDSGFSPGGDHPEISGEDLSQMLAAKSGVETLEMVLKPSKFADKLEVAKEQLVEQLGGKVEDYWADFTGQVWEKVSIKYVSKLQGRVTVFVDDWVLMDAIKANKLPVLSKELQELIRRKNAGEGITDIVIKDIFDGAIFEL